MSKEVLTEVLEGVQALQVFLSVDLAHERLSRENDFKRQRHVDVLNAIVDKIRATHPSIRPRMDTPTGLSKPGIPPKKPPPPPPIEQETEQAMYVECEEPTQEAENYLAFEPSPVNEEGPVELYEPMQPEEVPTDLYEEPVLPPEGPTEDYEEPQFTRPTPTPPPSHQENSGSGIRQLEMPPRGKIRDSMISELSTAEWEYDVSAPKEKRKVSELQGVTHKGYLEKLGGKNKTSWQKRFCVVAGIFLYFYEKESSKTFNNRIALPTYVASEAPNLSQPKKKHFAFKLTYTDDSGKKKDYFFRAASADDQQKWITAIRAVYNSVGIMAPPSRVAATLPRMPSQPKAPVPDDQKMRAASEGDLYEDINPEPEDLEEYMAVSPVPLEDEGPTEEYVDVAPNDGPIEMYEEPSFQPPPPPSQPPPSQPPPPPPDPVVDTTVVYVQRENGIRFENVFVALWDFAAGEKDEINLRRGNLVYVDEPKQNADWWYGELLDDTASSKLGVSGFFPSAYSTSAFEAVTS